jgi:hypothetical protein
MIIGQKDEKVLKEYEEVITLVKEKNNSDV